MDRVLTDDEMIALARQSPSYFVALALGLPMADVHIGIQQHLSQHDDCYIEEHRGIGKTTQAAARVAWEVGTNPNIRVKYVQHIKDKAAETVRAIRHIIEMDTYRMVFPSVVPDDENWGSEAFTVIRDKWGRDPTVQAEGINGRAGGRFDLLIADDICDIQNAIQKPMEREKVKDAWTTNWLPMADYARGTPRTWKFATPYHVSDITADWRRVHGENGSLLRQPVENYVSPWGEVWTPDILRAEREKMGPIAYGRAYELVPVSSEQIIFAAAWLDDALFFDEGPHPAESENIMAIDFAFSDAKVKGNPDYSVALFGRKTKTGFVFVDDMIRVRATFPDFAKMAIKRGVERGVKRAVAEGNGPQRGLVQQLNRDAPFPVIGMERDRDKVTRASEKQTVVQSGRFRLAGQNVRGERRPIAALQPLYDEMTTFPVGDHDDTVDAAIDLMQASATYTTDRIDRAKSRGSMVRSLYGMKT